MQSGISTGDVNRDGGDGTAEPGLWLHFLFFYVSEYSEMAGQVGLLVHGKEPAFVYLGVRDHEVPLGTLTHTKNPAF